MENKTKQIIYSAFVITLIFIATKLINIPTAIGGVINFGDTIILFSSQFLPLPLAFLTAAVGSSLADFLSPYAIYAPATFLIKGLVGFVAALLYKKENNKRILTFVFSESIMVVGYFVFEAYILGFGSIVAGYEVINNVIQAFASSFLALLLYNNLKDYIRK